MSKIPQGEWNAIAARHTRGETIARIAYDYGCTAPAIHYILKRQKERAQPELASVAAAPDMSAPSPRPLVELRPAAEVRASEPRRESTPVLIPGQLPGPPADARHPEEPRPERTAGPWLEARVPPARGNALAAGFDAELQNQIEESIAAFRANLNAALADRSPLRRAELRAAASDLMRMTARTMIVLDRLSAGHERAGAPAPDYPRPAHAR
ncbi:MAG: hypothetical protein ACREE1_01765 [Stellaceae bacterium]